MPEQITVPRFAIKGHLGQWVLLGLWGLLAGLSFPKANMWPLAYLALVPLTLLALRGKPLRRVVVYTYLAGVAWWLVMVRWMVPVTGPGLVAMSGYLGLYPLAYLLLIRWIRRRSNLPLVLLVPVVWVGLEYVRGRLLSGFPWFLLGHSQPTLMIQIADFAGAYGVSFVVAMTSGFLCDLLVRPLVNVEAGRRRWFRSMQGAFFLWAGVLLAVMVYGSWRLQQDVAGEVGAVRVAVVQTNVPQSNKVSGTDEEDWAYFQQALALTEQAAEGDPDLIAWPETMVPRALNDEAVAMFLEWNEVTRGYAAYREELRAFSRRTGIALLVGAHAQEGRELRHTPEGLVYPGFRERYNAAYMIGRSGGIAGRYDKIHLVPFGEYIPWVGSWEWAKRQLVRLTPYDFDYSLTAGRSFTPLPVEGQAGQTWRIGVPICFEDVVSYVPRRMVYSGGEKRVHLLVNMSNDGWFAGSGEGPQHEQIARFRCVENRVPMARAVNTGVSGFIDANGRVVERVRVEGQEQKVAGTALHEVQLDPRRTLFGRIGDAFAGGCLLMTIILFLWYAIRGKATRTRSETI